MVIFYSLITFYVGKSTLFPSLLSDGWEVFSVITILGLVLLGMIFPAAGDIGIYFGEGEKAVQGKFYRLKRAYLWFGIGNILLWLIGVIIVYMGHVTLWQYVAMAISVPLFCFSIFKMYRSLG